VNGLSPDDQDLARAAMRMTGQPGALDPIDADVVQRSFRLRDLLTSAGFAVTSRTDSVRYPRGVTVETASGHKVTLTPEIDRMGWNARIYYPGDPCGRYSDSLINAGDADIPAALKMYLAEPGTQETMRTQLA
jgi:hypothetical protein